MNKTEKRTQIYLTAEQHRRALELARSRSISLAAVVREALDRYLGAEEEPGSVSWREDPVLGLIGRLSLPRRSESNLNADIDSTLYE